MDNEARLNQLFAGDAIRLRRGAIFDSVPAVVPKSSYDRAEGMMLGLAIGDALGNTSEGQLPSSRRARFGEIRDYLPNQRAGGAAVGLPSDDSQMAFWTLEQLLADGRYIPENVATKFCSGRIFGIGSTVREFIGNYKDLKVPWYEAGPKSAGNGALMRIAPIVFPHLRTPSPALWTDAALCAMTTHNDTASITSCVALVAMLWDLLAMPEPPPDWWWKERFLEATADLEAASTYSPRGGRYSGYRGSFVRFISAVLADGESERLSALDFANDVHSGAFLLETVPAVLRIVALHGHDPEEAIVRAVNDTKDNDTVAAIVGALVGALHGRGSLPQRWLVGLSGRIREHDDGTMFDLLERARDAYAP